MDTHFGRDSHINPVSAFDSVIGKAGQAVEEDTDPPSDDMPKSCAMPKSCPNPPPFL
eukprot:CAMPEP_0196663990 /NCGR_PEP_ID=MMETSP1086-20130531/55062_1 /TAXON_ID=77921 /ORGANISM="Cyanoptyche  gloeocystis , Strain SAG4.97" /LENGTH=56 /DNA_ID=CAMNT_0042000033 /DNA_START=227 /DNA_END=394 /DNA_ORIENTATION=+